jgi:hypothetical protein
VALWLGVGQACPGRPLTVQLVLEKSGPYQQQIFVATTREKKQFLVTKNVYLMKVLVEYWPYILSTNCTVPSKYKWDGPFQEAVPPG